MPEVVSTCDGAYDRIVGQATEVGDDDVMKNGDLTEEPAPKPPKRHADPQAASSATTPVKQARQEHANDNLMF